MWKLLSPVGTEDIRLRSSLWSSSFPPINVGLIVEDASYCNSKKSPAFEAVGVVTDFVVVKLSKAKAARESLVDKGVEENDRKEERRCDRIVVLPEPVSPL